MNISTISQAMLKVSELERIYRERLYIITNVENLTKEYILEIDGTRYDCNEVLDFEKEFDYVVKVGEKISNIKTKISYANNNNYIEFEGEKISLQEALNKIKFFRNMVNNFENIINMVKSSKQRKVDAAATAVYYKVKEPNFNKELLKKYIEEKNNQILELEIALNKANNEISITID